MRIIDLLREHTVPFATEGHKHCRPGWVNMDCPFCTGNPGLHLGYNIEKDYFKCWRCGWHSTAATIAKILHISIGQAIDLIRHYGGRSKTGFVARPQGKKPFILPSGTSELLPHHAAYLRRRKFNPQQIIEDWHIMSTGPLSMICDKEQDIPLDYAHRILIPIYWNGDLVSFQGRDVSGTSKMKYKACPLERERVPHKRILYGKQDAWKDRFGICVEGVTDVWRLGPLAFATFGIDYTAKQVAAMHQHFDRIAIVFDDDPQAIKQAHRLKAELREAYIEASVIIIKGDPGAMPQAEADDLVRKLTNT